MLLTLECFSHLCPFFTQCLRLLTHSFNREYSHVCVSASESKVVFKILPFKYVQEENLVALSFLLTPY